MTIPAPLPDVASNSTTHLPIDQVGMANISIPILLEIDKQTLSCPASVSIQANVVNDQKGLHMSRMYQSLQGLVQTPLTPRNIKTCLIEALQQQREVASSDIHMTLESKVLRIRHALHTDQFGWNSYPIQLTANYNPNQGFKLELSVTITYSSSCPASAALSRSALKEAFLDQFHYAPNKLDKQQLAAWLDQHGTLAIPHSQRSHAVVTVVADQDNLEIEALIDLCETTLGTPVQTYVKRKDEQQFAINNGQNPMFVEDATRRLMEALSAHGYQGSLSVSHFESLHGHDAVAHSTFPQEVAPA